MAEEPSSMNATGWFWGGEGPGGGRGNNWNRAPREVGDELQSNPGGCLQKPDFTRCFVLRKESPPITM